jgi:hypothetical protein
MQVGSDGVQSCASFHFRAGADPRSINQLNPGGADNPDPTMNVGGPNYQLKAHVIEEGVAGDVLLEIPAAGRRGGPLPAGFLR